MNRETKVGLLAGMALILLIGILVSDHLSVGQKDSGADLTNFAMSGQKSLIPPAAVIDPVAEVPTINITGDSPSGAASARSEVLPMPNELLATHDAGAAPSGASAPHGDQVDPVRPSLFAEGSGQSPNSGVAMVQTGSSSDNNWMREVTQVPFIDARSVVQVEPRRYHTVKSGDSVYAIAQTYLGDGNLWTRIREANLGQVGPKGQVREGVRLIIPPIAAPADDPAPSDRGVPQITIDGTIVPGGAPTPSAPRQADPAPRRHEPIKVKPGQTLSELARLHLGSANRWPELLDANRDQIRRPEDLQVGMTLHLPGDSRPARGIQPASLAASRTYTVRSGDTLVSIARRNMGGDADWEKLYQANRRVIPDKDTLPVGAKLTIPQ